MAGVRITRGGTGIFPRRDGQSPTISVNGQLADTSSFFYNLRAGVLVDVGSILTVTFGAHILDNLGHGILADANSTVQLLGAPTPKVNITDNSEGGVSLLHHSVASFGGELGLGGVLSSGNGGGATGDLSCYSSSLAMGT